MLLWFGLVLLRLLCDSVAFACRFGFSGLVVGWCGVVVGVAGGGVGGVGGGGGGVGVGGGGGGQLPRRAPYCAYAHSCSCFPHAFS